MALLIGITTVLFPVLKYAVLFNGTLHLIPVRDSVQKVFSQLDKWSMIEVFILALIIMGIKSNSGFVSITMESGAYFLAVSVISRMFTSFYVSDEHTYVRVK